MNRYEKHVEAQRIKAEKEAAERAKNRKSDWDPVGPAPGYNYAWAFDDDAVVERYSNPQFTGGGVPDGRRVTLSRRPVYSLPAPIIFHEPEETSRFRNVMRELASNIFP